MFQSIIWYYLSRRTHQRQLKEAIRKRLASEDYTCRLPKGPKPRVRHKLTLFIWHGVKVWQ